MRFSFVAMAVVLTSSLSFANHGGHHHGGGQMNSGPKYWGNSQYSGGYGSHHGSKHAQDPSMSGPSTRHPKADAAAAPARTKKKIDPAQAQFMEESGFPDGRPGYVIAYLVPLKKGGDDSPSNMQWIVKPEPKVKDNADATPPPEMKAPPAEAKPRHHHRGAARA